MAKMGSGHIGAMGRQGLRELRAAMYPESNVAQQAEYGLYGTKTPGEVAESRRDEGHDLEDEKATNSAMDSRMQAMDARMPEPDRSPPEMDR